MTTPGKGEVGKSPRRSILVSREPDDPIALRVSIGGRPELGYYVKYRGDPAQVAPMLDECVEAFKRHIAERPQG